MKKTMKKVFRICCIYAKGNDWQTKTFDIISSNGEDFDTEEEAIKSLEKYSNGEYIILPFYKIK